MSNTARDACITGIGLVTCLGEGADAHWQKLMAGDINVDNATLAPYPVHPLAPTNFDLQIPKKGDQRQMEPWQRIGTYAAGLALDSAGIKGNTEILSRTDMIVAAGGGERDLAVDGAILSALKQSADPTALLNSRLMSDTRPTLFLAQLSNLLAGNISIVHGVTGSSRTFMGEDSSGVDAVRIACARINAGQSDVALVGGSYNAERADVVMIHNLGGTYWAGPHVPVWERAPKGGLALGSVGAFLVIESRTHAQARGAKILGKIAAVASDRGRRNRDSVDTLLENMWQTLAPAARSGEIVALSGSAGIEPALSAEKSFFEKHPDLPVRATGTYIGHAIEAQFTANIAIATMALAHGTLFPPRDGSGLEKAYDGKVSQAIITSVGMVRGEGMALIDAA